MDSNELQASKDSSLQRCFKYGLILALQNGLEQRIDSDVWENIFALTADTKTIMNVAQFPQRMLSAKHSAFDQVTT